MLLLVTQALPQMRAHEHPCLGRLLTPRHYCSLAEQGPWPWAADNDCYQGLQPRAYLRMLDALQGAAGRCLFVTVPDVVGDARASARLFETWWQAPARRGLPVALVAQDGLQELPRWLALVWPRIDALFIGGSTAWKLGPAAEALVAQARARGKWVHMGRVNSARRIRYAASIGCDSVDGSKWVRWRDAYLPGGLELAAAPVQLRLGDAGGQCSGRPLPPGGEQHGAAQREGCGSCKVFSAAGTACLIAFIAPGWVRTSRSLGRSVLDPSGRGGTSLLRRSCGGRRGSHPPRATALAPFRRIVAFRFTRGAHGQAARVRPRKRIEIELLSFREILRSRGKLRMPDIDEIFLEASTAPAFFDLPRRWPASALSAYRPAL